MPSYGILSSGIAALAYGALTAILLISRPKGGRAAWVTVATALSALWALVISVALIFDAAILRAATGLDAVHLFVWTAYMVSWLEPSDPAAPTATSRWLLPLSGLMGLWAFFASLGLVGGDVFEPTVFPSLLGMSLIGLLSVEQVYRNAREDQRRAFWTLCFAVGVIFVMDLFVHSLAMLLGGHVAFFWESRGIVNALAVPLLLVGIKRQSEWQRELFVSRQVTFYTASLLAVGVYLVSMAVLAQVIRALGGEWSLWLSLLFLAGAIGLLVLVLRSAILHARVKVFLVKHFYKNKYDYRHEWLRLTEALGGMGELRVLAAAAVEGLARIVGAAGADLFLLRDGSRYERVASLDGEDVPGPGYAPDHVVVRFLAEKSWVIDSREYAREPDRYGTAFGHPEERLLPRDALIVPLNCRGLLIGLVVLRKPTELGALNFEDHDILRTAGRQVAVVLAQTLAQEQLAETRQFEAMNKLSTFLMHDLKNVIAQQELVVANAQRFRDRPEFIDDAVATLRSGVERMRRLLDHLRQSVSTERVGHRTDLSKVLIEVRSHCADREPVPEIAAPNGPIWVRMEREQVASVFTHLIRNAQDATPSSGRIRVVVTDSAAGVGITVQDTGCGMDPVFVRDRLFRPFDTTKGVKGMGIGAYQVRDIVRAAGGDVEVESEVGAGTAFRLRIPRDPGTSNDRRSEPAA